MKIVYINFFYSLENMTGVEKKLMDEAKYYKDNNIDIYLLNNKKDGFANHIAYKKITNYFSMPPWLSYLYVRLFTFKIIDKIVPLSEYDKIYLRYPLMDLSALSFSKKYGDKLITQHHTKELEEIQAYKINTLFKMFQYVLEKCLAPYFFKPIDGLTAMSNEIISYEKKRLHFKKRTYRFSNGIDIHKFTMKVPPLFTDVFHVAIVASQYSPWHGLDRLLGSLKHYDGLEYKIHVHIIGEFSSKEKVLMDACASNQLVTIHTHGKLFGKQLDEVFDQTHMACDSLAMYRLDMHESSTLKSKEYIARGIPYLYSAADEDMREIEDYLYDVGNDDTLLDFKEIIKHYKKCDLTTMQKAMKECSKNILSWEIKVSKLAKFLSEEKI